jgi:hypothetical protein
MLLLALEGGLCIAMALPIHLGAATLGAWIGRAIALRGIVSPPRALTLVLILPLFSGVEVLTHRPATLEVKSSIDIDTPIHEVWPYVIGFDPIPPPTEWIFHTGVAYPTSARIDQPGMGAIRHCEFTTGAFVEPVTRWEPPTRLSFDVSSQPDPMEEWSPYGHIHPPHLDGYFRAVRGEFRLVSLGDRRTRLEGSTWYVLDVAPVAYWKLWADVIVHEIHMRVLRHIKALAEKTSSSTER